MNSRVATLKQLVADSTYPIDEAVIAEAILVRTLARRTVPDLAFRCASQEPEVRSFRVHRGALLSPGALRAPLGAAADRFARLSRARD